ncbi:MAG TPA: 2Fe-2S iron-sulfur cluster-binding protein, partial [Stellaceae bacterium]|nr:2Fe-2S iron-sulfur cluster-binding protein [Stellaceae bacterium]
MRAMSLHEITVTVNGREHRAQVPARLTLVDFLRDTLRLTGTHAGCEHGVCGACSILLDGRPMRSCLIFAVQAEGSAITTVEGLAPGPEGLSILQDSFWEMHALQCGFCTPGMLVTARDIVLRLGEVSEARIREELAGNLCRCTGYVGIVDAVRDVAAGRAPQQAAAAAPVAQRTDRMPTPPPAASPPQAAPARAGDGAMLEDRLRLAAAPDAAWAALSDLRRVAACLPGAQLDTLDGEQVTGRVAMALGPVKASFAGQGQVSLDPAARTGRLTGAGRDG